MKLADWLRRLFAPRTNDVARDESSPQVSPEDETGDDTTSDADIDPFNPFPEPVRLEILDVFDLHAIHPRDVGRVVEEYLIEARRAGFRTVRIIHGKGVGVQRERVRRILSQTPFVEHFTDAPVEAGSWGATIARLSADED